MSKNIETESKAANKRDRKEPLRIDMSEKMQPMDYLVLGGILAFLLLNLVLVVSLFLPK